MGKDFGVVCVLCGDGNELDCVLNDGRVRGRRVEAVKVRGCLSRRF